MRYQIDRFDVFIRQNGYSFLALFACLCTVLSGCASLSDSKPSHPFIGCWVNSAGTSVEIWEIDGTGWLLGYSRTVDDNGKVSFFEHMRVETGDEDDTLVVSGLAGPPVRFQRRKTEDANVFRFENPNHDFPQVIQYEPSNNRLDAWIDDLIGSNRIDFKKSRCD